MADALTTFAQWVRSTALPLWADAGFDTAAGRFRERLDQAGQPIAVPHRAMVQARQIYVYAHAAHLGWFAEGASLAEAATAALFRDFRAEAAGRARYAFSIDGGGAVVSARCDAYTHAFILLALAWMHRLTGDRKFLDEADRIIATIDADLHDPDHGGLFDAAPVIDRAKRQNPLMHLLEAYLALDAAAPARGYVERAATIVALFRESLFRHGPGVLPEHFAHDWAAHPDPAMAQVCEPGHLFEWSWLLDQHAAASGTDQEPLAARLHAIATASGIGPAGLIYDAVDGDLRPLALGHRVWPHTEAIKSALARARAGDPGAPAFAQRMAAGLAEHFLDCPFAGGWIDHLDRDLRPMVDYVPVSTLYHLFVAAVEARGLADGAGAGQSAATMIAERTP